jgi:hypothetical protein
VSLPAAECVSLMRGQRTRDVVVRESPRPVRRTGHPGRLGADACHRGGPGGDAEMRKVERVSSASADESEPKFTWHEPKSHTGFTDFLKFAPNEHCPAITRWRLLADQQHISNISANAIMPVGVST